MTSVLADRTEEHRSDMDVDDSAIKTVCDLLVEINCYENVFGKDIKATCTYKGVLEA